MKLTDYIVKELASHGIDVVFGYTGGSIADLVDSIAQSKDIRFIQTYHEQAAAFAANAYSQISGKTGIAIASGGPGAANLINGIANAYFDSTPCIFITGNVHSLGKKSDNTIRQNAFQEMDIVNIVQPITKYCTQICCELDIGAQLQKAFYIANAGRKGPVLIDIPYDIQRKDIDPHSLEPGENSFQEKAPQDFDISEIITLLLSAKRPLILIGGGCHSAESEINQLLEKLQIPVVASMRGIDIVPHKNQHYIGFIGAYGNRCANLAVQHCDLLIVLGSRLDERQMGYKKEEFAPNARIVQVDIDPTELGRKTDNAYSVLCKVECFVQKLYIQAPHLSYAGWSKLLSDWKYRFDSIFNQKNNFTANSFVRFMSDNLTRGAVITVDVGQNQIISAQSLYLKQDSRFICSAGLACMGYSIPASIGSYYADSTKQIVSINGDGGIQMNIQEMQTIQREKLPIKIIILNNHSLGLIRKLQEKIFQKRYIASVEGFSSPDFKKIAEAYGFQYIQVKSVEDYGAFLKILSNTSAAIIDVELPIDMHANPEPGEKIYAQEPLLTEADLHLIRQQVGEI